MKENENIVPCGYPVQFLLILENFCINKKLNLKRVSLYKPPLTPFWPCPAKQQGIFLSFHLRRKTNRQMPCIKEGRKGDKNWRKHVRARYWHTFLRLRLRPLTFERLGKRTFSQSVGMLFCEQVKFCKNSSKLVTSAASKKWVSCLTWRLPRGPVSLKVSQLFCPSNRPLSSNFLHIDPQLINTGGVHQELTEYQILYPTNWRVRNA